MSYFVCLCLETRKAQEEIDALREKYNNSVIEYDKLSEEHQKLQVRSKQFHFLSILSLY